MSETEKLKEEIKATKALMMKAFKIQNDKITRMDKQLETQQLEIKEQNEMIDELVGMYKEMMEAIK